MTRGSHSDGGKKLTAPGLAALLLAFSVADGIRAADQPRWGVQYSRNMVSDETNLPESFEAGDRDAQTGDIDLKTTKNVKWVVKLGGQTNGSPVVAGGKVFVGTNNDAPRDPRVQGDRGVLMCFDEKSGEFLWQLAVPKMYEIKYSDWHYVGISSPPVIEGDRAYLVSNRCEVLCLDVEGMANGNQGSQGEAQYMIPKFGLEGERLNVEETPGGGGRDDSFAERRATVEETPDGVTTNTKIADIVWKYDMVAESGVSPHNASNCAILMHGDYLYVCTSNGVEWTHSRVAKPDAPTVVVIDKNTGRRVARDDFNLGVNIIHGQWSSPALYEVDGRTLIVLGTGNNGAIYGFEALPPGLGEDPERTVKTVWHFKGHPLNQEQDNVPIDFGFATQSYEVTSMPVIYKNRVYIGITQDPWHTGKTGWFVCLDGTKEGDITRTGLKWRYDDIAKTISTASIHDGLVYIADFDGILHCLDAETGECYWKHDAGKPIWGSTLVADGKVYLGSGRRLLWVLKAGKNLEVINRIRMRDRVFTTPTAANGTLYVATEKHLYAIGKEEKAATSE